MCRSPTLRLRAVLPFAAKVAHYFPTTSPYATGAQVRAAPLTLNLPLGLGGALPHLPRPPSSAQTRSTSPSPAGVVRCFFPGLRRLASSPSPARPCARVVNKNITSVRRRRPHVAPLCLAGEGSTVVDESLLLIHTWIKNRTRGRHEGYSERYEI